MSRAVYLLFRAPQQQLAPPQHRRRRPSAPSPRQRRPCLAQHSRLHEESLRRDNRALRHLRRLSHLRGRGHWPGTKASLHDALDYATEGHIHIMSTSVTGTRTKSAVKIPAHKTNNQASFGGSLLKNNMDMEAVMELARHLDNTGLLIVYSVYTSASKGLLIGFKKVYTSKKILVEYCKYLQNVCSIVCLHKVHQTIDEVFTWFVMNLH